MANTRYDAVLKQREAKLLKEPEHVFKEFEVVELANGDVKLKCKCGVMVACANPLTSMNSHHGGKYCKRAKLKPKRPAEDEVAGTSEGANLAGGGGKKRSSSIVQALIHIPKLTAEVFKEAIMYWALICMPTMSLIVMAHPLLTAALALLGISAINPKDLAGPWLDKIYEKKKEEFRRRLQRTPYVQVVLDAWKRRTFNKGFKIVSATVNFAVDSAYAGWYPSTGQSIDANFLLEFMEKMLAKQGGEEKVAGFVTGGEAACVKAAAELEEKYRKLVNFKCQAHGYNLLARDLQFLDPATAYALEGSHAIIVFVNNHDDVRIHLQATMDLLYHGVLALAPGTETRFVTKVLELARLLKTSDALCALANTPELRAKYVSGSKATPESQRIFALLTNGNFWKLAEETLELLQPIADVIHHIEADRPVISQLPRVSEFMEVHVQRWWDQYRSKPVEWELGFGGEVLDITAFPAASAFKEAVQERHRRYSHPDIAVAHILDPRFWAKEGSACRPDTAFALQDPEDFNEMRALVRRVCGGEDGGAAADTELLKLMYRGSTDSAIPALALVEMQGGWKLTMVNGHSAPDVGSCAAGGVPAAGRPGAAPVPHAPRLLQRRAPLAGFAQCGARQPLPNGCGQDGEASVPHGARAPGAEGGGRCAAARVPCGVCAWVLGVLIVFGHFLTG